MDYPTIVFCNACVTAVFYLAQQIISVLFVFSFSLYILAVDIWLAKVDTGLLARRLYFWFRALD